MKLPTPTTLIAGVVVLFAVLMVAALAVNSGRSVPAQADERTETAPRPAPSPEPKPPPPQPTATLPPTAAPPAQIAPDAGPCVRIQGDQPQDLQHLSEFCRQGINRGVVVRAEAMQSLLWIYVPRDIAEAMRRDRLSTEQLIKTWMRGWRQVTGQNAVTVYVRWNDVDIAKGDTSIFSGDQVTIR